jgi:hypothetical protein
MKTRLTFCSVILGVWTAVSCSPVVLGAVEEPNPPSREGRKTAALNPTSSAATTAQITEKFKAAQVSPAIKEIVRMSEAGMDTAVIQAYVENSSTSYNLRAEEIIYLREHGIHNSIITALIQRGAQPRESTTPAQANAPAQAAPPAASNSSSAQPTVTYVAPPANPAYAYSPSYTYNSPSVIVVPYSGYNYYSRPYFGFGYGLSSCGPYGYGGFGYGGYGYYGGYGGYHRGYGGYHGGYGFRHCR